MRRARAFLHDALADKITLDDLAEHAGLDKFHLVRAFRAEVGLPPYEYLTHLRVSRAKELLRRGALRRRSRAGRRLLRREPAPPALPPHRRRPAGRLRQELRLLRTNTPTSPKASARARRILAA